jgi:hypothetical protein
MNKDYLQKALATFNGGDWYGWKKIDSDGNKIPNDQRMCYDCVEVIKDGAILPSEAEVNAKIQELKDAEANKLAKKASAKTKLYALGLDEDEINAIIGTN